MSSRAAASAASSLCKDDIEFHQLCIQIVTNASPLCYHQYSNIVNEARYCKSLIDSSRVAPLAPYERRELESSKRMIRASSLTQSL